MTEDKAEEIKNRIYDLLSEDDSMIIEGADLNDLDAEIMYEFNVNVYTDYEYK